MFDAQTNQLAQRLRDDRIEHLVNIALQKDMLLAKLNTELGPLGNL